MLSFSLEAQIDYAVSNIPEELLKGADAVIRNETEEFIVYDKSDIKHRFYYAVTLLNSRSAYFSSISIPYDGKAGIIKSLKGNVYDASGKLVKKLKKADISDVSLYDGVSLYSDNRANQAVLKHDNYPYTIEVEYEYNENGTLFYPIWRPQFYENVAVQKSTLTISTPADLTFRFKEYNLPNKAVKTTVNNMVSYTWTLEDQKAIKKEPYTTHWTSYLPGIITSPDAFSFGGYEGDASSWKALGKWQLTLNESLDNPSEELKDHILRITEDKGNIKDKIRAVYDYVQQNTRYISIQLGIGGWRPYGAEYVEKNGYGDCKALTNFTYSLLKSIGIESYYTLVRAGASAAPMITDFPSRQFNHVILAVPLDQDTVWLECTSQTNPFGYLGTFAGDRHVLIVTPDGGKVGRTVRIPDEKNLIVRVANVELSPDGGAKAQVATKYQGTQYEKDGLDFYVDGAKEDQREWLYDHIDIPSFDLVDFRFSGQKSMIPEARIDLEINLRRYASLSGKRLFLDVNLLNKHNSVPKSINSRKSDFQVRWPYTEVDTITYMIPENLDVEHKSSGQLIESRFGTYQSDIIFNENKLTYTRRFSIKDGVFDAILYSEFVEFHKNVAKADRSRIVFIKKE